jgi:hypothetical protein
MRNYLIQLNDQTKNKTTVDKEDGGQKESRA